MVAMQCQVLMKRRNEWFGIRLCLQSNYVYPLMHALFTYVHCSRTRILVPLECRATEQSLSCSVSILALNPDTCKPVLGARNRSLVHPPQPCLKLVIRIPREESRIHPSHLFQVLILTFLLILFLPLIFLIFLWYSSPFWSIYINIQMIFFFDFPLWPSSYNFFLPIVKIPLVFFINSFSLFHLLAHVPFFVTLNSFF